MLIGGFIFCGSILVMSFSHNYWVFLFMQSVVNATGKGLIYMLPVRNAWHFYPQRKGLVSGIILMCYSIGAIIWSFLTTVLTNPDYEKPTLIIPHGESYEILYEKDSHVVDNVPYMLRTLAIIYFVMIAFATLMISKKEKESFN